SRARAARWSTPATARRRWWRRQGKGGMRCCWFVIRAAPPSARWWRTPSIRRSRTCVRRRYGRRSCNRRAPGTASRRDGGASPTPPTAAAPPRARRAAAASAGCPRRSRRARWRRARRRRSPGRCRGSARVAPTSLHLAREVPLFSLLALTAQILVRIDDGAALAQHLVDLAHVLAKRRDRACDPLKREQQLGVLRRAGVRRQNRQRALNLVELFVDLVHVTGEHASLFEDLAAQHPGTSFAGAWPA